MNSLVSKVRARKTRTREKNAVRATSERVHWTQGQVMGVIIAIILWLLSLAVIGIEQIITPPEDIALSLSLAGSADFLLLGLIGTGLLFKMTAPELARQNSKILLISTISFVSLTGIKALLYLNTRLDIVPAEIVIFLIPFSISSLLATILVDHRAGVIAGIWTSLATALMMPDRFELLLVGMIVTVLTAYIARNVRTRTKVLRTGLIVGLCKILFVSALTATRWPQGNITLVLHQASACIISGFFSAIIVLLILPLFESLFRITTDIALLELADLDHPLLQRLAIEAPGTYHHSLVVANLAQAAADEIGANSLLARISAYFHDIGKLTKPDFFSENIQFRENPHDNLPPSMSTLVITAHVKEGISLAVLHKLPQPVMDVIREHHGTSLLSYFHHKAKSQLEFELGQADEASTNGQAKLDEGDFRYPGPKPTTRESAIICLADPVEAASRSMKKTTPGHIENMINEIVFTRLKDGQLDECNLTLLDLTRIKRSFVFTLTNMLHGRVPYPEDENRDKQPAKQTSAETQGNKGTDRQDNAKSASN